MPVCTYPGGCSEYAVKGNVRCSAHIIRNKSDEKQESTALKKMRTAAAVAEQQMARQEQRSQTAQTKQLKHQRSAAMKSEVIRKHRQAWNQQIDAVVAQVMQLRITNPGANAGNNSNGNTEGGTGNPLLLVMSGPTHGVTRGEILMGMTGFDNSDSGAFKFRRQQVFVHCK